MHLKRALAKYIAAHQGCQELDKNLSETCQNNNSCSRSARTKGGGGTPPRGASIELMGFAENYLLHLMESSEWSENDVKGGKNDFATFQAVFQ